MGDTVSNGSMCVNGHVNGKLDKDELNNSKPFELVVVRHAERVDSVFPDWITNCFDESGKYRQVDLNLPKSLLERKGGPKDYMLDCPITEIGYKQALLTGEGMRRSGVVISAAYTSPSLRCVHTCAAILKGLGQDDLAMRVEPGQGDYWGSISSERSPVFLTNEELIKIGMKIEATYKPAMTFEEFYSCRQETLQDCYERVDRITRCALDDTTGGTVLVVGHMSSLDMCTCLLEGRRPAQDDDISEIVKFATYCCALVSRKMDDGKWKMVDPQPFLPLTHSNNSTFDAAALKQIGEMKTKSTEVLV